MQEYGQSADNKYNDPEFYEIDPYSACLSRINMALTIAFMNSGSMSDRELNVLKAIRMECDAADDQFDWVQAP